VSRFNLCYCCNYFIAGVSVVLLCKAAKEFIKLLNDVIETKKRNLSMVAVDDAAACKNRVDHTRSINISITFD
jgi:hypothetical protein